MTFPPTVTRLVPASLGLFALVFLAVTAFAQNELRSTFFRDADTALAAADEANAQLLAPSRYADGMKDYQAAEAGL